jgi:hypothetical protein
MMLIVVGRKERFFGARWVWHNADSGHETAKKKGDGLATVSGCRREEGDKGVLAWSSACQGKVATELR